MSYNALLFAFVAGVVTFNLGTNQLNINNEYTINGNSRATDRPKETLSNWSIY